MHYLLPLSPSSLGRFDKADWGAYLAANKQFSDRLVEIISPDDDYIWVHDYHLMLLPSFLRKRFNTCRMGFFLHCPFPSSELFRTFPARESLLRALLNCDVIGFHTFDYARHFLSCCSRMLGLAYHSQRGVLGIEYYGRKIAIKICPTGINTQRLRRGLAAWPEAAWRRGELLAQFAGKTVLIGVDDMDVFKGIDLKLRAFRALLEAHPELRGRAVLIQVANPARAAGKEVAELRQQVHQLVQEINGAFGGAAGVEEGGAPPVTLLERHVPLHERIALYSIADCAVVTAVRDGMNLMPYEYVACREGAEVEAGAGAPEEPHAPRSSALVVSEFVGCSPSLSGALRVNPWNIEDTADALYRAVSMPAHERTARHEKHWRYVREHTAVFWAASNFSELQRACRNHAALRCYGLGFGLNFRIVALDPYFRRLPLDRVFSAYAAATRRALVFDFDGTLAPPAPSFPTRPTAELLASLAALTADPANVVYIVSGRRRALLDDWFGSLPQLGCAAEHGAYLRPPGSSDWEELLAGPSAMPGSPAMAGGAHHLPAPAAVLAPPPPRDGAAAAQGEPAGWREVVLPILELYTDSTDGSFVERKESALVWHYADADPEFGSTQAKELLDHMESVLSNEPVEVVAGTGVVEIKPQGVSKGQAVLRLLEHAGASAGGRAFDFSLCMGDDRSDEEMFAAWEGVAAESPALVAGETLFNCTVGQKPSRAAYFLNDPAEAAELVALLPGGEGGAPAARAAARHESGGRMLASGGDRDTLELGGRAPFLERGV